jgi:hypothetical protein
MNKKLIDHRRKRRIPAHFSWVDHNLVRNGYSRKCSTEALGLYLFLLAVSDSEGLSYYGDMRISREINCSEESVSSLRRELISAELIAFSGKIYQVLDIAVVLPELSKNKEIHGTHSMNDILEKMFGGIGND